MVLTYSARRRSGLSSQDLIITKFAIDFYLSSAYISRSEIRRGIMVIHPRRFHGPSCRSACGGGAGENDRRKGGNAGNLMLAAARGRQFQQSGTVKEAKTVSRNCRKCRNRRKRGFAVHPVAETGQSLAETAETPCKNFARETVRVLLSLFRGALHSSGALKTTGGNAGNAQISCQASAGSGSDHEAAIART